MVIIHLNDRLILGGVSTIIKILSIAISKNNWIGKIYVAENKSQSYPSDGLISDYWGLAGFGKLMVLFKCICPLKLISIIKENLKLSKVVIHLHTPYLPVSIAGFIAAKICRVPLIYTVHANRTHIPKFYKFYEGILVRCVDKIVLELRASYRDYPFLHLNPKMIYIPFGVDEDVSKIQWKPHDGKEFVFVAANRLDPNRMTINFIKAFIDQKCEKDRLLIIGDGIDKEYLSKYINDAGATGFIEIIPAVKERYLQEYFARADCFLTLSASGDVGMAAKIAANMSMPLIAYEFDTVDSEEFYSATSIEALSSKMRNIKNMDKVALINYGAGINKLLAAKSDEMTCMYMDLYKKFE